MSASQHATAHAANAGVKSCCSSSSAQASKSNTMKKGNDQRAGKESGGSCCQTQTQGGDGATTGTAAASCLCCHVPEESFADTWSTYDETYDDTSSVASLLVKSATTSSTNDTTLNKGVASIGISVEGACVCVSCKCGKCMCRNPTGNDDSATLFGKPAEKKSIRLWVGLPTNSILPSTTSSSSSYTPGTSFGSSSFLKAVSNLESYASASTLPHCVRDPQARARCSFNRRCVLSAIRRILAGKVAYLRGVSIPAGNSAPLDSDYLLVEVILHVIATPEIEILCKESILDGGFRFVYSADDLAEESDKTSNHPTTLTLSDDKKWRHAVFNLDGMTCTSCTNTVTSAIRSFPGVNAESVSVTLKPEQTASVDYNPAQLTVDEIKERIEDLGFIVLSFSAPNDTSPVLNETLKSQLNKTEITLHGMTCASCVGGLEKMLKTIPGIESSSVIVTLLPQKASLIHNQTVSATEISNRIEEMGYDVLGLFTESVHQPQAAHSDRLEGGDDYIVEIPQTMSVRTTLSVGGMTCASCVASIETAVKRKNGVKEVNVSLLTHKAVVVHDPAFIGPRDLIEYIQDLGYEASLFDNTMHNLSQAHDALELAEYARMAWIAFAFALPIFVVSMVIGMMLPEHNAVRMWFMQELIPGLTIESLIGLVLATPVQFGVGWRFYKGAYKSLVYARSANMDVLVALGTTAAYIYSVYSLVRSMIVKQAMMGQYFETSVFLIFFILYGKYLECYAKGKTGEAVAKLLALTPDTAILVTCDNQNLDSQLPINIVREEEISVGLVQVGDVLKVPPGSRFPCDGVVVMGSTHADESMLTGEPLPQAKSTGDSVTGGTLNATSMVLVKAIRVGSETALSRIVKLVEDAQSSKAPIQALADKVSHVFVPAVVVASIVTFAVWMGIGSFYVKPKETVFELAVNFAIAVLVIACPCALGLATPTAVMVGTGVAAQHGILIKGGGVALQAAREVKTIIFDKTGTLTMGSPTVTDASLHPLAKGNTDTPCTGMSEILQLVLQVESASTHPLAKAAVQYASKILEESQNATTTDKNLNIGGCLLVGDIREVPGMGLVADLVKPNSSPDGGPSCVYQAFVGSRRWVMEVNSCKSVHDVDERENLIRVQSWQSSGCTVIYVGIRPFKAGAEPNDDVSGSLLAMLAISDPARPTSASAIAALQKMGIRVIMMTGDQRGTAVAIARQIGIPESDVIAGCLPHEKGENVEKVMRGLVGGAGINADLERGLGNRPKGKVAFAGDGINDSVALATADVGIAMGAGSDIAIESASAVLLRSDLVDILTLLSLSRKVISRIHQNLFAALAYNVLGIPIAAGLLYPFVHMKLEPWMAGLAMALSSVSVVASSLALKWYKPPKV
ncbi:hypothetical protein HDV05_005042 [Chytridiales sp. JEL 0842]|nr:hypothetical protein HDV05_005042 [Chytridiales sp. JEL 0842]